MYLCQYEQFSTELKTKSLQSRIRIQRYIGLFILVNNCDGCKKKGRTMS